MTEAALKIMCKDCVGTGKKPSGDPNFLQEDCADCGGTGFRVWGAVENLDEKLDAIIDEQAAQRVDLTDALTRIWNKVKDL